MICSEPFEVTLSHGHSLHVPEEIGTSFLEAGHHRVEVLARFEGKQLKFHAALRRYKGVIQLMFSKQHQKTLGIFPNDYFSLQFFEDTSKYGVELPEEMAEFFRQDPELEEIFDSLTPGARRSLIYYITRYKVSQTRVDKFLAVADGLRAGRRNIKELLGTR
jgi:hypothetical protein